MVKFKLSYDYEDLIKELNEELRDGILQPDSFIQILRNDKGFIVDWNYDEQHMEWLKDELPKKIWKQYEKDKPNLESVRLKDVLEEMVEVNSIF